MTQYSGNATDEDHTTSVIEENVEAEDKKSS